MVPTQAKADQLYRLSAKMNAQNTYACVFLQIFRKSVEFCNEHEIWKLNVAHVLFMQVSIAACTANNDLDKLNETDCVISFLLFFQ